jgi:hypothetical protein
MSEIRSPIPRLSKEELEKIMKELEQKYKDYNLFRKCLADWATDNIRWDIIKANPIEEWAEIVAEEVCPALFYAKIRLNYDYDLVIELPDLMISDDLAIGGFLGEFNDICIPSERWQIFFMDSLYDIQKKSGNPVSAKQALPVLDKIIKLVKEIDAQAAKNNS